VWVSQDGGSILTPDAADMLIRVGELRLIGRTASTLVVEDSGREVTFHRMPGANYV
jgi:hypothetical protein